MSHTQRWRPICPKLRRVQEVAQAKAQERFTSLAHLLTEEALTRSFRGLRADAAPGVDGQTKASYGEHLEHNVHALHQRLKAGRYRAQPVLRHWLDKPDGGQRPIGLPALEDKIVQGAVVEILNSIYETDFYGFSYGFRPGRGAHQALRALQTVLQKGRVNWVLDLDLEACFDRIECCLSHSFTFHRRFPGLFCDAAGMIWQIARPGERAWDGGRRREAAFG